MAIDAISAAVHTNHLLVCDMSAWMDAPSAILSKAPPDALDCEEGSEFFNNSLTDAQLAGVLVQIDSISLALDRERETSLEALDAVQPGFKKLLYQLLERVNATCMPVFTPRSVVEHLFHELGWSENFNGQLCDVTVARMQIENYGDIELEEKYGLDKPPPAEIIAACEEEYGTVFPSECLNAFGQAVNDPFLWRGRNRQSLTSQIRESLANLTEQAHLRTWCQEQGSLLKTLDMMRSIFGWLEQGACFANQANNFHTPCHGSVLVYTKSEHDLFTRLYDDACSNAESCGDTLSCVGYMTLSCDSAESALQQLQSIQYGALVCATTLQLLQTIGQ